MAHATQQTKQVTNTPPFSQQTATRRKSNNNNKSTQVAKPVVMVAAEGKRGKGRPTNESMGLPEPDYMKRMAARAEKRGMSLDDYMAERKENRRKAALAKKAASDKKQNKSQTPTPMAKAQPTATKSRKTKAASTPAAKESVAPQTRINGKKKGEKATAKVDETPKAQEVKEAQPEMTRTLIQNDKPVKVVVKSTTDFSKFSLHPANRHIIEARVKHLKTEIEKRNMLHLNPIIVDMEMRIVNGQHRFRVAKELGLPIYYIQDEVTAQEMLRLNANQKSLALKDYLDSFVAQGYPEYIKVKEFIDKYKTVLYNAIGLLSGRRSQPNSDLVNVFKDGEFVVRDMEHAEHIMKLRDRMSEHASEFHTQKNFTNAVAKLVDMKDFDESHFVKQVEKKGYGQLHPAINTDLYTKQFIDLYNHGLPKKKQLHLEEK